MLPDLRRVEQILGGPLALSLRIAGAEEPLSESLLSAGERSRHGRLSTARRRRAWLLGRAALKGLLRRMGEEEDTAKLSFPHPRYSLTHSGVWAVAVGAPAGDLLGIGVDLELSGAPRPEAARFFLTPEEQDWAAALPAGRQEGELRRLWTVKEALFKSDPDNDCRTLSDYRIENPAAVSGSAFSGPEGRIMRYASVGFSGGLLSVAVLLNEEVSGCLSN